jgi:hypothetical protein
MLDWNKIVGKTIKEVDDKDFGSNVVRIKFTDGFDCVIDTETIAWGLYAPILFETKDYGELIKH